MRVPRWARFLQQTGCGSTPSCSRFATIPAGRSDVLQQDGFHLQNGVLLDRDGHAVEFSIITNSGNKYRERMASMIQQDLGKIGITVNVVTLDFPSLIERITEKFNYEAVLLGLVNNELDPNAQMNVWLSSGDNHQWNPRQTSPETGWEAEIDQLMRAQASAVTLKDRKRSMDRVQEIVAERGAVHLSGEQECVVRDFDIHSWRSAGGVAAANVLEHRVVDACGWDNRERQVSTELFLSACISVDYRGKRGVLRDVKLQMRGRRGARTRGPERFRQEHDGARDHSSVGLEGRDGTWQRASAGT